MATLQSANRDETRITIHPTAVVASYGSNGGGILLPGTMHLTATFSGVLDRATSEIASRSKFGMDATKKISGEDFKRPWPPLIRMSDEVRRRIDALFRNTLE